MSARCPLPSGRHEVEHAGREGVGRRLELDPVLRVERGQVVEEDLLLRAVGRLEVDRVDLDEGEVALVFLGRADLAADRVPGAQVELADLGGRDVDVVGTGQVAVLGGAQEAEAVGQDLEHALGEDEPFLLRLGAQDLEDQLLLLHGGRARDLQRLGHRGQLADAHLLELGQVEPVALGHGGGGGNGSGLRRRRRWGALGPRLGGERGGGLAHGLRSFRLGGGDSRLGERFFARAPGGPGISPVPGPLGAPATRRAVRLGRVGRTVVVGHVISRWRDGDGGTRGRPRTQVDRVDDTIVEPRRGCQPPAEEAWPA